MILETENPSKTDRYSTETPENEHNPGNDLQCGKPVAQGVEQADPWILSDYRRSRNRQQDPRHDGKCAGDSIVNVNERKGSLNL